MLDNNTNTNTKTKTTVNPKVNHGVCVTRAKSHKNTTTYSNDTTHQRHITHDVVIPHDIVVSPKFQQNIKLEAFKLIIQMLSGNGGTIYPGNVEKMNWLKNRVYISKGVKMSDEMFQKNINELLNNGYVDRFAPDKTNPNNNYRYKTDPKKLNDCLLDFLKETVDFIDELRGTTQPIIPTVYKNDYGLLTKENEAVYDVITKHYNDIVAGRGDGKISLDVILTCVSFLRLVSETKLLERQTASGRAAQRTSSTFRRLLDELVPQVLHENMRQMSHSIDILSGLTSLVRVYRWTYDERRCGIDPTYSYNKVTEASLHGADVFMQDAIERNNGKPISSRQREELRRAINELYGVENDSDESYVFADEDNVKIGVSKLVEKLYTRSLACLEEIRYLKQHGKGQYSSKITQIEYRIRPYRPYNRRIVGADQPTFCYAKGCYDWYYNSQKDEKERCRRVMYYVGNLKVRLHTGMSVKEVVRKIRRTLIFEILRLYEGRDRIDPRDLLTIDDIAWVTKVSRGNCSQLISAMTRNKRCEYRTIRYRNKQASCDSGKLPYVTYETTVKNENGEEEERFVCVLPNSYETYRRLSPSRVVFKAKKDRQGVNPTRLQPSSVLEEWKRLKTLHFKGYNEDVQHKIASEVNLWFKVMRHSDECATFLQSVYNDLKRGRTIAKKLNDDIKRHGFVFTDVVKKDKLEKDKYGQVHYKSLSEWANEIQVTKHFEVYNNGTLYGYFAVNFALCGVAPTKQNTCRDIAVYTTCRRQYILNDINPSAFSTKNSLKNSQAYRDAHPYLGTFSDPHDASHTSDTDGLLRRSFSKTKRIRRIADGKITYSRSKRRYKKVVRERVKRVERAKLRRQSQKRQQEILQRLTERGSRALVDIINQTDDIGRDYFRVNKIYVDDETTKRRIRRSIIDGSILDETLTFSGLFEDDRFVTLHEQDLPKDLQALASLVRRKATSKENLVETLQNTLRSIETKQRRPSVSPDIEERQRKNREDKQRKYRTFVAKTWFDFSSLRQESLRPDTATFYEDYCQTYQIDREHTDFYRHVDTYDFVKAFTGYVTKHEARERKMKLRSSRREASVKRSRFVYETERREYLQFKQSCYEAFSADRDSYKEDKRHRLKAFTDSVQGDVIDSAYTVRKVNGFVCGNAERNSVVVI